MDWIFHLDTDELIHPAGTREYSLRQLLADVPGNVDMVIFPNYVRLTTFLLVWHFFLFSCPIEASIGCLMMNSHFPCL